MDFGLYLPGYWPDVSYPMQHMYREMVAEAAYAEALGFTSFTIPEHHFSNALVHPSPLLTAIKVAENTKRAPIVTATSVLPFHDMRRLAGEIAQADCLTMGRIGVGVGRGAYAYEFERFEKDPARSGDQFRDSLLLLVKLLSEEEVSWDSEFYKLPPTTITPRPVQKPHPPIWFAAMKEGGIDYAVSLGMPVLTTPLRDPFETVKMQAGSFRQSVERHAKPNLKLSMLVMLFVTKDKADTRAKAEFALGRHSRFLNVFTTPGTVRGGAIEPIESDLTVEEIERNLIIGTPEECIEKLALYADEGIHEMQLNMSFGASHHDIMDSLEAFATRVMPHFA